MSRLDLRPLWLQPQRRRGLGLRPGAPEDVLCTRPSVQLSAQHQFRCMQMLSLITFSVIWQSLPESSGVSILKIERAMTVGVLNLIESVPSLEVGNLGSVEPLGRWW